MVVVRTITAIGSLVYPTGRGNILKKRVLTKQ